MALRQIKRMKVHAAKHEGHPYGTKPKAIWVSPTSLWVDDDYQREMSLRGQGLVRKILRKFKWSKYKPPICIQEGEKIHCIDGQHTATAAATLGVPEILVIVVDGTTVKDRAESFTAHNEDRIPLTSLDRYKAKLAQGDEAAIDTQATCKRAGVRIVAPGVLGDYSKAGDTQCIAKIYKLVDKRKPLWARKILQALVLGGSTPIRSMEIDAMELFLCDPKHADVTVEIAAGIVKFVGESGVLQARLMGTQERKPAKFFLYRMYENQWKKLEKAA